MHLVLSANGKYTRVTSSADNENVKSSDLLLLLPLVAVLQNMWPDEINCYCHTCGNTKEKSSKRNISTS